MISCTWCESDQSEDFPAACPVCGATYEHEADDGRAYAIMTKPGLPLLRVEGRTWTIGDLEEDDFEGTADSEEEAWQAGRACANRWQLTVAEVR